ncbi:TNT domain-containing protein, partial [Paenarthrobacter sp. NPDC057355]|uniref:TNT domain-containing protein n=1 Tax=Paenarthrobacter sp. NPDC057355 TaxID=3346105 RepID=UPI00363803C4
ETTAAVTAKLAKARTALWNNGIGAALEKLDTGLGKLNQTLDSSLVRISETAKPSAHINAADSVSMQSPVTDIKPLGSSAKSGITDEATALVDHAPVTRLLHEPLTSQPGELAVDSTSAAKQLSHEPAVGRQADIVEQSYGEPREVHGQHPPYPELFRKNRDTLALVSEADAKWGRSDKGEGTIFGKNDYDVRYTDQAPEDGSVRHVYPPNGGVEPGTLVRYTDVQAFTQDFGTKLDRIGSPGGKYLGILESGERATFESRSLPVDSLANKYFSYRIAEKWPHGTENWTIEVSRVAPAFGRRGGALQLIARDASGKMLTVNDMLDVGLLIK